MVKNKAFWFVVGILIFNFFGILLTGMGVFYRLLYLTILFLVVSWVWTNFSLKGLEINRNARGNRHQLGEIFEEQFEVVNAYNFRKGLLEIVDQSKLTGIGSTRIISEMKANTKRSFSVYTLLSRRGEYRLGPTKISTGDPFGIFKNKMVKEPSQSLIVMPYLVELESFIVPSGRLPGGSRIRKRTPEVDPPRVASVREHAPGDSFNRIHWPSTAKKDRLMVKEFEQDPQLDIWILLDANKQVQLREDSNLHELGEMSLWWINRREYKMPKDTIEYSASIAGSIARYLLHNDQVVGFAFHDRNPVHLVSERGNRQLDKILETLAILSGVGNMPVNAMVNIQLKHMFKGSTVILITPAPDHSVLEATATLIRKGMQPILVILNPSSFGAIYGVESILPKLNQWNVPYTVIDYGDDLKDRLENGFQKE